MGPRVREVGNFNFFGPLPKDTMLLVLFDRIASIDPVPVYTRNGLKFAATHKG